MELGARFVFHSSCLPWMKIHVGKHQGNIFLILHQPQTPICLVEKHVFSAGTLNPTNEYVAITGSVSTICFSLAHGKRFTRKHLCSTSPVGQYCFSLRHNQFRRIPMFELRALGDSFPKTRSGRWGSPKPKMKVLYSTYRGYNPSYPFVFAHLKGVISLHLWRS